MYFNTLSVNNFGVFHGRHDFILEPAKDSGKRNGRLLLFVVITKPGKSTLFQAMTLALHGSLLPEPALANANTMIFC